MEILIVVIIASIVFFALKVKINKKNANNKIENIIIYTADFLEKNPKEMTVNFDDVKHDELLNYVKRNLSKISNFEQLDANSISFVTHIKNLNYRVYGTKFIFGQLVIATKKG